MLRIDVHVNVEVEVIKIKILTPPNAWTTKCRNDEAARVYP